MQNRFVLLACLLGAAYFAAPAAHAAQVYSPTVEKGEFELEWEGGVVRDGDSAVSGEQSHEFGIGYGFTNNWSSEIEAEIEKPGLSDESTELEALTWKNIIMFSEPGQYWLDSGLLVEYEHAMEDDAPDALEVGLLLEKQTGKFVHTANILLEREFGDNHSDKTEAGITWATRYRMMQEFEPGFEIYSNFGPLGENSSFDDEEQFIGPVIQGKLPYNLKYNAGYLFGVSDAAPDGIFKWVLEYEMYF